MKSNKDTPLRKIARLIANELKYQIKGKEWGILGKLINTYGQDNVIKGVRKIVSQKAPFYSFVRYLHYTIIENTKDIDKDIIKQINDLIEGK